LYRLSTSAFVFISFIDTISWPATMCYRYRDALLPVHVASGCGRPFSRLGTMCTSARRYAFCTSLNSSNYLVVYVPYRPCPALRSILVLNSCCARGLRMCPDPLNQSSPPRLARSPRLPVPPEFPALILPSSSTPSSFPDPFILRTYPPYSSLFPSSSCSTLT
jgi:hypothetical protein